MVPDHRSYPERVPLPVPVSWTGTGTWTVAGDEVWTRAQTYLDAASRCKTLQVKQGRIAESAHDKVGAVGT